ncbi:hypothetical protein ACAG13_26335, partial [Escherichia coli]|uniref:hypothetical protein n=1 Tax=Escherichia coli TaxID=562 RepID=UPI003FA0424B
MEEEEHKGPRKIDGNSGTTQKKKKKGPSFCLDEKKTLFRVGFFGVCLPRFGLRLWVWGGAGRGLPD